MEGTACGKALERECACHVHVAPLPIRLSLGHGAVEFFITYLDSRLWNANFFSKLLSGIDPRIRVVRKCLDEGV